jgi:Icc-related predicted phosphoesterase
VTLAVIGDVHAHWRRLDAVLVRLAEARPDGILLVGDLGSHDLALARMRTPERDARYRSSVEEVLRRVRALRAPTLFVPGNHDLRELEYEGNVDGGIAEIAGVRIAGIGGAGPARFGFAYEWGEDEIRARDVPECDVILSHAPPARTSLDLVFGRDQHVGSEAIRERALAHRGVLVCGHIHESPGAEMIGECLCVNVGGLGAPFGRAQVGFVRLSDEIDGGFEAVHEDLERARVRRWTRG